MVRITRREYTLKNGSVVKELTVKPNKQNQLFTYDQIKQFLDQKLPMISKDKKVIIRALNVLQDTTLKGYNDDSLITEDEYDSYLNGEVKDPQKFKHFFNFTISIRSDPEDAKPSFFH